MSCEELLKQLAMDLMDTKKGSRYFKGNNVSVLQAFIRYGGICVYCEKELWKVFGVASCGDHLLPKSAYPDLAENVDNLVPACAECNHIKHYFDPTPSDEKGRELVATDEGRRTLILRAKEKIKERKKNGDWEQEFEVAKVLFDNAVAQYRRCKESVAAA